MEEYLKAFNDYEKFIQDNPIDERVINAYMVVACDVLENRKDIENGLMISKRAKEIINKFVTEKTQGGDIWALEKYAFENQVSFQPIDDFWKVILAEARSMILDSYFLYLERYRDPEDRFYLPRRNKLIKHGYVQGLQDLLDDRIDILSISSVPGSGKAQPLYSKVLTPNGFVPMKDIKVGDTVISGTGNYSKVCGVYPQGKKPIYEITFDDGSKCRCSDQHLWTVQTRRDRLNNNYRTVELSEMLGNLRVDRDNRKNYSVDYVSKIEFPKKELKLHPYVMGSFLGNGCFSNMTYSTQDEENVEFINTLLPDGYSLKHKDRYDYMISGHYSVRGSITYSRIVEILAEYGLRDKHSYDKFIPKAYLYSSYEDRLWLLRGLLDTDGYTEENTIEYSTVSPQLAEDVIELVHSLGGYASVKKKRTHYNKNGNKITCRDAYRVTIQFTKDKKDVFKLSRKADKYNPKREVIKRFIDKVEYVGEEECQCIYIDDPSHLYITDNYIITHNTTLGEMFLSGYMGWFPDLCNLFSSHSGHVTRMVYEVESNILGVGLKQGQIAEYAWREIFPDVIIESVNAKEEEINLGKFKPFKTLTCRALGASQTGVTRCEGILYCDDLCSGIEMALSKVRLDKLWTMYSTDLKTRKKKGKKGRTCKELHIATRWSVWDVIGRLKNIYQHNDRCRFISVPDIDPDTGESNFEYDYGVGFDVAYFEDIQKSLDEVTYKCLYKNQPVEREGLLFHPDTLRRYGSLPYDKNGEPKEPDAILAFCDTKDKGTDYNCLGVFKQYEQDYYFVDTVFRSIDPLLLDDLNAQCLVRNNVQIAEFESNKEGSRTADKIQEKVNEMGGKTAIQKKYSTANKETRIIVNSPWVVGHVLFPFPESPDYPDGYKANSEIGQFMSHLCSYSQLGHNPNDDAPDMVTMLAIHENPIGRSTVATVTGSWI